MIHTAKQLKDKVQNISKRGQQHCEDPDQKLHDGTLFGKGIFVQLLQ